MQVYAPTGAVHAAWAGLPSQIVQEATQSLQVLTPCALLQAFALLRVQAMLALSRLTWRSPPLGLPLCILAALFPEWEQSLQAKLQQSRLLHCCKCRPCAHWNSLTDGRQHLAIVLGLSSCCCQVL